MTESQIRVMLVDDNPEVGFALKRWLERSADFGFLEHVMDLDAVVGVVRHKGPHVVLMDLDMPGGDTIALVRVLAAMRPGPRVAMLSAHTRTEEIRRALDAGATGYLSKLDPPATIAAAIRLLAEGRVILSKNVERALEGMTSETGESAEM